MLQMNRLTSGGSPGAWFSVMRRKVLWTAGSDTRNTGRTVDAMETNRWHAESSSFSGTWGGRDTPLHVRRISRSLSRSLSL